MVLIALAMMTVSLQAQDSQKNKEAIDRAEQAMKDCGFHRLGRIYSDSAITYTCPEPFGITQYIVVPTSGDAPKIFFSLRGPAPPTATQCAFYGVEAASESAI
jgi:hypothetical protein